MIAAMLILLAFSNFIDNAGYQRTDEALTRALATYGIAISEIPTVLIGFHNSQLPVLR